MSSSFVGSEITTGGPSTTQPVASNEHTHSASADSTHIATVSKSNHTHTAVANGTHTHTVTGTIDTGGSHTHTFTGSVTI